MALDFKDEMDLKKNIRMILDDIQAENDSHCCYHGDAEVEEGSLRDAEDELLKLIDEFLEKKLREAEKK